MFMTALILAVAGWAVTYAHSLPLAFVILLVGLIRNLNRLSRLG